MAKVRVTLRKIWPHAKGWAEWFRIAAGANERLPDGFYFREAVAYFFEVDGELNGERLDPSNPEQVDKGERALRDALRGLTGWKLLSFEMLPPREGSFTRNMRFRLFDEHKWNLTKKGRRLARASVQRQHLAFAWMLVWLWFAPVWRIARTAAPALLSTFGLLRFALQWEASQAAIAAMVAAVVASLSVAFS